MQRNEKLIIKYGELVARNKKPECGHFYRFEKEIFRAMPDRDETVYPIVTESELAKMIKNDVLLPPISMDDIEKQIDATIEVAKENEKEACLLKSVNELKAILAKGVKYGLSCNEGRTKQKFAELQKACNARLKPKKKSKVKK